MKHLTHLTPMQAQELLERLIATPRTSREEAEAASLLHHAMTQQYGLATERAGNNLWAIAPGYNESRPTLLLCAHIDTVRPTSGWTVDPFTPTLRDGRLYGLGSNDDGASLVALLATFGTLCHESLPYNIIFLASAEEEVSGKGGVEHVLPLLPHIDVALVGEPTGMQPAIAERGLMVLDVTEHGRAGHAARDEGDNAIYHALEDIHWFRHHRWERVSDLLGPVRMTTTIIQAGTQHNVVPDRCTFTVDIRTNELYRNEELFSLILPHVRGEVKARSFRLGSSRIDPSHPLVRRAVEMGRTPFGSPTLSDQALMPFPSLKMGPGESNRSHTANEYILVSEVEEAIMLYTEMLRGLKL